MAYRSPLDQDTFNRFSKETKELKTGLIKILPLFNVKKGWADIERTLQKINLHFKHVETPYIFQKPILFRRLAQCLNQREEGIHQTVLEIYERILFIFQKNNEFLMNDLYFLTVGLFAYLQNSLFQQNRRIYLLLAKYVMPLKAQLGPLVPALMAALFPGLIENNSEGERMVYEMLYGLLECLPKAFFYGSIWLVLFRSPTSRFGILKFMNYHLSQLQKQTLEVFDDEFSPENQIVPPEVIQTTEDPHREGDDPHEANRDTRGGNMPTQDQDPQTEPQGGHTAFPDPKMNLLLSTVKGTPQAGSNVGGKLDIPSQDHRPREPMSVHDEDHEFMAQNFQEEIPESKDLPSADKQREGPGSAQDNPPPSIKSFFVTPENPETAKTDEEAKLLTLENELNNEFKAVEETDFDEYQIFKKFCDVSHQNWTAYIKADCANEVFPHKRIVLSALTASLADPNTTIVQKTLDFIILFAPLHGSVFSEIEFVILLQSCLRLFENADYPIKRRIFKYIFSNFSEDETEEELDQNSIHLIIKALKVLFEKSTPQKDTKVFKILQTIFMQRDVLIEPLVTGLAKSILHLLSVLDEPKKQEIGTKFFMNISTYYYLFVSAYIDEDPSNINENELRVLSDFGKEHIEFTTENGQKTDKVPHDLQNYHRAKVGLDEKVISSMVFSKTSLSSFNKLPSEKFEVFDNEEDELPFEGNNIGHLIRLKIFEGYLKLISAKPFESEQPLVSMLEITKHWQDLHFNTKLSALAHGLLQKFKENLNAQVFGKINEFIFEQILRVSVFLLQKLNDNVLTNDWASHLQMFLSKYTNNPLYCLASIRGITEFISTKNSEIFRKLNEAAIKSSWRLMDDLRFHNPAFVLVNELARCQLPLIVDILNRKMKDVEIIVRIEFLQRIITFWKVANAQIETCNVELDENLTCILLDHIEDPHPVLRQLAKSWLFDSSAFLDRILDPIVRQLIVNCRLFTTVTGRFFHITVFNADSVLAAFKRLQIVVSNNPTKFANFVLQNPPSKIASDLLDKNQDDDKINRNTYSEVLIAFGIRFLRASVLPFMGRRFIQDNLLVSTAACELLEILIKLLQSVNTSFLSEALVEILLKSYYQFVADRISTMQVNMINLMKVILFQSGFLERNKRNLSLFEKIFREKRLLENVISSIQNNRNSHTLLKIVDFLDTTIEIFSNGFFPENKLKDVISLIFEAYFSYINEDDHLHTKENKFNSIVVLIEAVFKFLEKYFNLEEYEIPDPNRPKRSILFRIMTLGLFGRDRVYIPPVSFKLIEAYFLEYFDKVMLVLLKGWNIICYTEKEYKFSNIGPYGFKEIYGELKAAPSPSSPGKSEVAADDENPDAPDETTQINQSGEGYESRPDDENAKRESLKLEQLSQKIKHNQDNELLVMTEKIYYKYPKQFTESLVKAWVGTYTHPKPETSLEPNLKQAKIMDLIAFFKFSIEDFNKLIMDTEAFKENKLKNKKNKGVISSFSCGAYESAILALYYGFLKYKEKQFIEDLTIRKQELRKTWNAVCEFLQEFTQSCHPQVDIWVICVYHLCANKYPAQEIIGEYSIKKLIHVHENIVLEKIVAFIVEDPKIKLPFEKSGENEFYSFVMPLPAIAVDMAFINGNSYLSKFTANFEEDFHLRYYTKVIALMSLKSITMELLKMTYENKSNNRIAKRVHNIISKLFIYIESLLKNKLAINENLYVEIIEYLFIFLDDSRDFLMEAFEAHIEKFFDSDLFFECPVKSLGLWSHIIFWQTNQANKKILNKYLYKCPKQHELLLVVLVPVRRGPHPVQGLPQTVLHPLLPVSSPGSPTTSSTQSTSSPSSKTSRTSS